MPNVYFIFAGSQQHMVSDMFLSPERPLYQGAQIVAIREIDEVAFENYYASLTMNQAALLTAIACERYVTSPMSQAFISKYHLPALSSIKMALESLSDSQYIYRYKDSYVVYDRFFGMWLSRKV